MSGTMFVALGVISLVVFQLSKVQCDTQDLSYENINDLTRKLRSFAKKKRG